MLETGRKMSKALTILQDRGENLQFRACKAIKTRTVKMLEKGHAEKSEEVTLTGLPKRHLLNSQVVRAMRLKIHAESLRNSERNF